MNTFSEVEIAKFCCLEFWVPIFRVPFLLFKILFLPQVSAFSQAQQTVLLLPLIPYKRYVAFYDIKSTETTLRLIKHQNTDQIEIALTKVLAANNIKSAIFEPLTFNRETASLTFSTAHDFLGVDKQYTKVCTLRFTGMGWGLPW